jgi:glycosyltransferase involved in cell wall biosynthesis
VRLTELSRRRRRDAGLFLRLARLAHRERVDVIHCHDELAWFYGAVAGRLAGCRVVMTMHGRRRNISFRHLVEQRALAALTSSLVSVSGFLQRQVAAELCLPLDAVTPVPNGVRPLPEPDAAARGAARRLIGMPDESRPVFGSVGELSEVKDFELALDAVALARRDVPDLQLTIAGDGSRREALEQKVRALGLERHVCLLGLRRDVPALLPGFDAYVCSSRYEGISLSILEAMSARLPVIATEVGGNPELVRPGHTGVLVPPGGAQSMADAMVRLVREPETRRTLGAAARAFVCDRYAMPRMLAAYQAIYLSR